MTGEEYRALPLYKRMFFWCTDRYYLWQIKRQLKTLSTYCKERTTDEND